MSLSFVGLGLTPKDLSIRALETIAEADVVFGEAYTTRIPEKSRTYLEQILKQKILKAIPTHMLNLVLFIIK